MVFVISFASVIVWLSYFGKMSKWMSVCSTVFWTLSFVFLVDALIRIKKVMQLLTEAVLIYNAFVFYAVTAGLAIVG